MSEVEVGGDGRETTYAGSSPLLSVSLFCFLPVLCAAWEFSLVLSPSLAYLGFIWRTPRLFSAFLITPLSVRGRDMLSSHRQPPQTHRFRRTLETHLHTNRSFCFFLIFLATVLLPVLFAWLLGTSERIHLCFIFLWNSGHTLLTQTGNRRGKAVEEYGRKKKGETNDEDIQIPTPLAGATFFFRLFAAVQDHHTSLARDKLTYFLC